MSDKRFVDGQVVQLWVGLTLMGYPERGIIDHYIEDYPGGPTYQVNFEANDFVPLACLKPEWLFPVPAALLPSEVVPT